jgi:hypothetical protein
MDDREIGVAGAEPLDRLLRLELDDLDDDVRVSIAQLAHRRRHERGQRARECSQAHATPAAPRVLHRSLGPGGFSFAPRGTVHNFRNTADTPSRVLVGFTPGGMERFFRDSGRPATHDGPAPPVDEDEIARTMAAARRYGVEAVAFDG